MASKTKASSEGKYLGVFLHEDGVDEDSKEFRIAVADPKDPYYGAVCRVIIPDNVYGESYRGPLVKKILSGKRFDAEIVDIEGVLILSEPQESKPRKTVRKKRTTSVKKEAQPAPAQEPEAEEPKTDKPAAAKKSTTKKPSAKKSTPKTKAAPKKEASKKEAAPAEDDTDLDNLLDLDDDAPVKESKEGLGLNASNVQQVLQFARTWGIGKGLRTAEEVRDCIVGEKWQFHNSDVDESDATVLKMLGLYDKKGVIV